MADSEVDATEVRRKAAAELLKRRGIRDKCQDDLLEFIKYTHPKWDEAPHHRLLCDWLMKLQREEIERLAIFAPPRHGKLIADSYQVLTTKGWKTHGSLEIGDFVFHPSGRPTKVIAVDEPGVADVEVELTTGEKILCHENHEWLVFDRSSGQRRWRVIETNHLLRTTKFGKKVKIFGRGRATYQLPPVSPLEFDEQDLPIDPYVLGAWLGDGSKNKGAITYHPKDPEPAERIRSIYPSARSDVHKTTGCITEHFIGLKEALSKLLVIDDKRIPEVYKKSSIEQRLSLLAGLIDTDGSVCNKTNRTRFINTDEVLVKDVCEIIRSLGWRVSVHAVDPCVSSSGIIGRKVTYYVGCNPTLPLPLALERKQHFRKPAARKIGFKSARRVEPETGRCIQVDSPDGLYLIGESLVPTHNSEIVSRRFPAWCMGLNPDWEMICVQANGDLARNMGSDVRDIIATPEFRDVFPTVMLRKDAKAAGRWLVQDLDNERRKNGVYQSSGITGSVIGKGANLLNIDDPLDAAGAASPRMRDVASDFYYKDCRPRLMTPGLELLTTTRRHEDGLEGRILPSEDKWELTDHPSVFKAVVSDNAYADPIIWWVIKLPAIANEETEDEYALWPGKDPARFPLRRLKAIRGGLFDRGLTQEWYCQYQQEVTPESGNFCKYEWFADKYDTTPEDLWIYATSDYAVTEEKVGKDPDFTEHCVFGLEGLRREYDHQGNQIVTADAVYVLDWWFGKTKPDVWIDEMVRLIEKWHPQTWFGTKGVIRNSLEGYISREIRRRRAWCRLEWLSDIKRKEAKGVPMQGMASQRRILFPKTTWAERVIQNVCTFPNAAHDDAYDTLSNAIRALGEIPDAFSGAPIHIEKQEPVDCYEFVETESSAKNWKWA